MKTQVTITMDPDLRDQLKAFAKRCGLSLSGLIAVLGSKTVETQRLEVNFDDYLSPADLKDRAEAIADLKAGRNVYSLEEMQEHFSLDKNV